MRIFFLLCMSVFLVACGFHFSHRDQLPDDFTKVYVTSGDSHTPMYAMLKQLFKIDGVLTDSAQQAQLIFHILRDTESTSSVSTGSTQETRVYQLIHSFSFQLEDTKGQTIYGPITLSNSMNDFVYAGQVIGNSQELPPSYQKLREKAIQQMLLLLSSSNVKKALHDNQLSTTH